MIEFFAMGGYAFYVWPAYIVSALGLAGLFFAQWRRARRLRTRLRRAEERAQRPGQPNE